MRLHTISTFRTKRSISSAVFGCLIVLFSFVSPVDVSAQGLGATFEAFDVEIRIQADGTIAVKEQIRMDFFEERHGIFRVIPTLYATDIADQYRQATIWGVTVTDEFGRSIPTVATDNDAVVLKIGDPDKTITGEQRYVISYVVGGVLQSFEETDELFWNVTGTEWETPPVSASARVFLPANVPAEDITTACYTGPLGSEDSNCFQNLLFTNEYVSSTENDFLTVAVAWPKGYVDVGEPVFVTRESGGELHIPDWIQWLILLLPVGAFLFMYRHWRKHGDDPKGRGTIVPQYEPPKGLGPAEMGTLLDANVHPLDLSAEIVQLAVKGHLVIKEEVKERFGPDKKTYSLEKKSGGASLKAWEQDYLDAIFQGGKTVVTEKELKKSLSKKLQTIKKDLVNEMIAEGYYDKHPGKATGIWIGLGVFILIIAFQMIPLFIELFGRALPLLAIAATGAIILGFGVVMARRTEKGVAAYEHAKGFKMFLEKAEKYRLEWQEKEGIFEQYLPYAMVFGVADKWAKAFADLHIEQKNPGWFVGAVPMTSFNAVDFTSSLGAVTARVQSSAIAPGKSGTSSSSFGGGGFSGGGFGGGGGGSW